MAGMALLAASAAKAQDVLANPPPAGATVSGVTVTMARADAETTIDRKSYSVANDLAAQTGSVADALRDIPAVQVDAQGNPSLQGEGNVTILIDGRPSPQFSGGNLGQALQAMPADQVDRIEVMTNPPAEFQVQGKGGVINLITKKARGAGHTGSLRIRMGDHDRTSVTASLGYNSARLSAIGDVTFRRTPQAVFDTLNQSQADPATGLALASRDLSSQHWITGYWQAHGGADYDLDERTRLSASARFTSTAYVTADSDRFIGDDGSGVERTGREHEFIDVGEASLSWRRTFGQDRDLALFAGYRGYEHRYHRFEQSEPIPPAGAIPSDQFVSWTDLSPRTTLMADYEQPFGGGKLKLGYDFEDAPKITEQDTVGSPDANQHGAFLDVESENEAYASFERRFGKLSLLAGLRGEAVRLELDERPVDQSIHHAYPRLYPSLHLAYDLGAGRMLTASFSRRTNVPYSEQLDPLPLSQTPVYLTAGNPDLRPENAYGYELAYERSRDDGAWSFTLYDRQTRDAFSILSTERPDAVILETTVNAGDVRRAGGEWTLRHKLSPKLSYNISLDAHWTELSAANLGLAQPRSLVTGFGRAGLAWQATPKDFVQVNLFSTAKGLLPQGYVEPSYSGNIGLRHTINNNVSWMLVADDPFGTQRSRRVETIDGVKNRRLETQSSQSVSLAFVWAFAGKKADQGFDFGVGGAR